MGGWRQKNTDRIKTRRTDVSKKRKEGIRDAVSEERAAGMMMR